MRLVVKYISYPSWLSASGLQELVWPYLSRRKPGIGSFKVPWDQRPRGSMTHRGLILVTEGRHNCLWKNTITFSSSHFPSKDREEKSHLQFEPKGIEENEHLWRHMTYYDVIVYIFFDSFRFKLSFCPGFWRKMWARKCNGIFYTSNYDGLRSRVWVPCES